MLELLSNILNSQLFAPIVIVWLVVCFANQSARNSFVKRISVLISKPIIFKEDEFPNDYAFYPRRILEQISVMFREAFTQPLDNVILQFKSWINLQISLAYRPETPIRVVGYFIYLAFFILFAWGNAISIVTSLEILKIFEGQIPQLLTSFEIAVFMGSLGSAVIAGLVLMDIQSQRSVLSNWDEHGSYWRTTARAIAIIIIIFAVMIVMALGLQRLVTTGLTASNETLENIRLFTNFAILALVPVNNVLSIVLISYEAILGILVVLIAIQMPLLAVMSILNLISSTLGTVFPFLLDILYRFALLVLDLLFYVILTPIDTIIGVPVRLIEQMLKK